MSKITNIKTIEEYQFRGLITGIYSCKFENEIKVFTLNDNVLKVVTHYMGHDELDDIREDVAAEFFKILNLEDKQKEIL